LARLARSWKRSLSNILKKRTRLAGDLTNDFRKLKNDIRRCCNRLNNVIRMLWRGANTSKKNESSYKRNGTIFRTIFKTRNSRLRIHFRKINHKLKTLFKRERSKDKRLDRG